MEITYDGYGSDKNGKRVAKEFAITFEEEIKREYGLKSKEEIRIKNYSKRDKGCKDVINISKEIGPGKNIYVVWQTKNGLHRKYGPAHEYYELETRSFDRHRKIFFKSLWSNWWYNSNLCRKVENAPLCIEELKFYYFKKEFLILKEEAKEEKIVVMTVLSIDQVKEHVFVVG